MESSPRPRRQGIGLVFILLAVIAALAIAVVLLSQLGNNNSPETTHQSDSEQSVPTMTSLDSATTTSGAERISSRETSVPLEVNEEDVVPPVMTFPPPPPPPLATPNSANLPPEG